MSGGGRVAACGTCGQTGALHAKGLCPRCYARTRQRVALCIDCGEQRRLHRRGRCARCYRNANTSRRGCGRCGQDPPAGPLPAGDYGVHVDSELVAAVERKSLADLASSLIDGSLTYQLADLARLPRAAVVVEDRYAKVFKLEHVSPGFVAELLATVRVRYPTVPIFFAETRPLAEEWTFRFLGAALAFAQADQDTSLPS